MTGASRVLDVARECAEMVQAEAEGDHVRAFAAAQRIAAEHGAEAIGQLVRMVQVAALADPMRPADFAVAYSATLDRQQEASADEVALMRMEDQFQDGDEE